MLEINLTLLGQMITFAIFVWFTMKYVWPILTKILAERQATIAAGLHAAERGHKELELAQKAAVKELKEAREGAELIIEKAQKQATLIIEHANKSAVLEKEKILEQGKIELEQTARMTREQLRNEVVNLAILGAEKILNRVMSENDKKKMINLGDVG